MCELVNAVKPSDSVGRAASGGAVSPEPPRATGVGPLALVNREPILSLPSLTFFEIGHLTDARSDINRSQIGNLKKASEIDVRSEIGCLKKETSKRETSDLRSDKDVSIFKTSEDSFSRCPI